MVEMVRSGRLRADRQSIWDVLADFGAISRWADNVDHSWLLDDVGPGATRRIQSGRTTLIERIVTWDPPGVLAYRLEGLPSVLGTVVNRWDLTDRPDGGTDVTITTTIDTGSRGPRAVIARLATPVFRSAAKTLMNGLAAHVDGPAGTR